MKSSEAMILAVINTILATASVYRKPTNTGLLLHFDSHVDKQYKSRLIKTMIYRAYRLSSTPKAFNSERVKLRAICFKIRLS